MPVSAAVQNPLTGAIWRGASVLAHTEKTAAAPGPFLLMKSWKEDY